MSGDRHQWSLKPARTIRGGTITSGRKKDSPLSQLMFSAGFALSVLNTSTNGVRWCALATC